MADKWITAIADSLWVKESYGDEPGNPSAKVLIRSIYGISRVNSDGIIDTLNATKNYANGTVYVNGAVISGTWRVIKNEALPMSDGSVAGSDRIVQTLGQGYFTTLSASNKYVLKPIYEPEQQNENAWMYYERGTILETSRWVNIASTSIASLFPYTTSVAFDTAIAGYDTPVIHQNWYEREQDGSYSMYRSLFARATTATMKTRSVQYAGMLITSSANPPVEGDTTIKISGFSNATETIYANAKFTIGGDTYRVSADAAAVSGEVTVSVIPEVTLSTETYCDTDDGSARQVYFEALS